MKKLNATSKSTTSKSITTPQASVMQQIVIKVNKGHVAVGTYFGDEVDAYQFPDDKLVFGVDNKDNSMANATWVLTVLLEEARERLAGTNDYLTIAVPYTVCAIANNIELLTRMIWTKKYLADKAKLDRKRDLTTNERITYQRLLTNYRNVMGRVIIINSKFTPIHHKEGETITNKIWCELNMMASDLIMPKHSPQDIDINDIDSFLEEPDELTL